MGQSELAKLVPEFWFIPRHPLPCGSSTCCSARLLFAHGSRDDPPRSTPGRLLCNAQLMPSHTLRCRSARRIPDMQFGETRRRPCRRQCLLQLDRTIQSAMRVDCTASLDVDKPSSNSERIRRPVKMRSARIRSAQLRIGGMMPALDDCALFTLRHRAARAYTFARASPASRTSILRSSAAFLTRSGNSSRSVRVPACMSMPSGSQPMQRQSALSAPSSRVA